VLGLGFRDSYRVRVWVRVKPGQGGRDGSQLVQCPLSSQVLSGVPDCLLLQQKAQSVEDGTGRSASSFSAKICTFFLE